MKYSFLNVGEARARIQQLEDQLGIPHGDPITNLKRANQRVSELEALASKFIGVADKAVSTRPAGPVVTVSAIPVFTTAAATPVMTSPAPPISRQRLIQIGNVLSIDTRGLSDTELQAAVTAAATAQGIQLPGQPAVERTGSAFRRSLNAARQDVVSQILKDQPAKR
jgi:hypothetical protein